MNHYNCYLLLFNFEAQFIIYFNFAIFNNHYLTVKKFYNVIQHSLTNDWKNLNDLFLFNNIHILFLLQKYCIHSLYENLIFQVRRPIRNLILRNYISLKIYLINLISFLEVVLFMLFKFSK